MWLVRPDIDLTSSSPGANERAVERERLELPASNIRVRNSVRS
jgi:hypothetical protein